MVVLETCTLALQEKFSSIYFFAISTYKGTDAGFFAEDNNFEGFFVDVRIDGRIPADSFEERIVPSIMISYKNFYFLSISV